MNDVTGRNDAQAAYWDDRAASWIEAERWWHSTVTVPFGVAAIERLDPRPGQHLLDIGCGTGPTSIELGRLVAPGGTVQGLDISSSMVDAARTRAGESGLDNVRFDVADVQSAPLAGRELDGVLSRFGVMFFTDPAAAFANVRTGLRTGGHLAFACWQELVANEWMFVPGVAAVGVTGRPPSMPGPGQPGPFSLCDPDRIRALLAGAGYTDVSVDDVRTEVVIPEVRVEEVIEAAVGLGAVHEQVTSHPDLADAIVDAVRDEMSGRLVDGEVRLAAAAWVVSATA